MKTYIKDYAGRTCVFNLCFDEPDHQKLMKTGYNHLFIEDKAILYTVDGYQILEDSLIPCFQMNKAGDVFSINSSGIVNCIYSYDSNNNVLMLTSNCNSNCIMCPMSEKSRRSTSRYNHKWFKEVIKYLPEDAEYLTITGGEPTLIGDEFFDLLETLKIKLARTDFQLLTNGRIFCVDEYADRFVKAAPDHLTLGIPIYGYNEATHDHITQSAGSFKQTVAGIKNLINRGFEIEIRIVVSKLNYKFMTKIASFIADELHGISRVDIMGLEMLGNAAKNKSDVWIPYSDAFDYCIDAINRLILAGVDVSLYNFPLCSVKESYRYLCKLSISDYKVSYSDDCKECDLKKICGGVFNSTRQITGFKGTPIT